MKYLLILLTLLLFTACSTYSEGDKNNFDKEIKAYLKENGIICERSSSGLYFKILKQGEGRKIQYKDRISFTYKGELLDGTVFDDLREPVEFNVSDLIAAWKEIVLELNEGGKAYLVSPPYLGYGTHELDDIPPNSIIAFTMEVVEVK